MEEFYNQEWCCPMYIEWVLKQLYLDDILFQDFVDYYLNSVMWSMYTS